MKIRNGWVSNSSSSSFIVSVKDKKDVNDLKVEISLKDCIKKTFSTVEEFVSYCRDEYGCESYYKKELEKGNISSKEEMEDNIQADLENCTFYEEGIEAIKRGETIVMLRGSSEDYDNPAGMFLHENGIPESNKYTILDDSR